MRVLEHSSLLNFAYFKSWRCIYCMCNVIFLWYHFMLSVHALRYLAINSPPPFKLTRGPENSLRHQLLADKLTIAESIGKKNTAKNRHPEKARHVTMSCDVSCDSWGPLGREGKVTHTPLRAQMDLVVLQWGARELQAAVLAVGGQFRDGFLHSQVARTQRLADLAAAVGTRGCLVLQPGVGQQVCQTAGTHEVAIRALKHTHYITLRIQDHQMLMLPQLQRVALMTRPLSRPGLLDPYVGYYI